VIGRNKKNELVGVERASVRYLSFSSWPGLTRPSHALSCLKEEQDVDARHKAGHDEQAEKPKPYKLAVQQGLRGSGAICRTSGNPLQSNRYGMETFANKPERGF